MMLDDRTPKEHQGATQTQHSSGRYYTQTPGSVYILPSDEEERLRLSLQHKVLHKLWGNRLIVAPLKLTAGDHILESGVGGGDWVLDVSATIPENVTIDGIDIENRLFPKDKPENVTFSVNSITNLPDEWTDRFRYVHQRLLIGALRKSEWPLALGEIFRVLKPGGLVELHEVGGYHEGPEEYTSLTAHKLKERLCGLRGLDLDINDHLPGLLTGVGFVDIVSERKTTPIGRWGGENAAHAATMHLGFFRGLKKGVLEEGGFGEVKDEGEFDKVMDELGEWLDRASGMYYNHDVHIGQKPLPLNQHLNE